VIFAIVELKQQNPAARILVLTGFADEEMGFEAAKAGAAGYLLKTAAVSDLIRAIHSLCAEKWSGQPGNRLTSIQHFCYVSHRCNNGSRIAC
jgi:DNA-binding NarL/FixJ family response regulator